MTNTRDVMINNIHVLEIFIQIETDTKKIVSK
jgi:hypothetical protein